MTPSPAEPVFDRVVLGAFVAFVVLAIAASVVWETSGRQVTDLTLYRSYGELVANGEVPYRDFSFEYPPGALPLLVAPALVTSGSHSYSLVFAGLFAILGGLGIVLVARTRDVLGRSRVETRLVAAGLALSPLLLGALFLDRFDLLPAVLTVAALLALLLGRDRLGGGVLGAAIAVKLYPVVLLPLAVAWVVRRKGSREGLVVTAIVVGVTALAYVPFLLVAPGGVATSIGRQLGRPLQIESLGSGILLALHHATGMGLDWESSHGSQNLTGVAADVLAVVLFAAQVAVLVGLWVRFGRGPATPERLVLHAAAAVVAFVALGKVVSPQFLIWPLFLVPLVAGSRLRAAVGFYALAALSTAIWFPVRYWSLVKEFDPLASWLVLARGTLLVALLVTLSWPFLSWAATRRGQARSQTPVRSSGRM